MASELKPLTEVELSTIGTDFRMRNAIAYAHQCADSNGNFKYYKAMYYPIDYTVTSEQMKTARKALEADKKRILKSIGNKLVFVGMGMPYKARYDDDVCNHRIRTSFINSIGKRYFIELGTGRDFDLRIDFSIDSDLQKELDDKMVETMNKRNEYTPYSKDWKYYNDICAGLASTQPYYNYAGLERNTPKLKYTLQNVLSIVNKYFDCLFTDIEIDYYTLSCDEFTCQSPQG